MRRLKVDLHIHTALSPCGAREMTPPAIVRTARRAGLAMIAICDHNAAGNVAAVQEAAEAVLTVIAGMEITTAEEAHVLGLFPDAAFACAAADVVRATLPEMDPAPGVWGEQLLMDKEGRVTGREPRLLAAATDLDLAEVVRLIRSCSGLAIASHVDRPSFSVLSQLGMFPEGVRFDALEVSPLGRRPDRLRQLDGLDSPIVCSSDSHYLSEIGGGVTWIEADSQSFGELALALSRSNGRRVLHA
ncbi:MAG: PHP domain-containing protein [Planctomycetota bacterium]